MGTKATNIYLSSEDRAYPKSQTRTCAIQVQTVYRARILLLKADGTHIADKVGMNRKTLCSVLTSIWKVALIMHFLMFPAVVKLQRLLAKRKLGSSLLHARNW